MATRTLTIPDNVDAFLVRLAQRLGTTVEGLLLIWARERWQEEIARRRANISRDVAEKWDALPENKKAAIEAAVE